MKEASAVLQFVCSIIRQRLFAENDLLRHTGAVKIVTSLVAAERDAAAVESTASMGFADRTNCEIRNLFQTL
ncbi:unnamed protein product [Arctia plantaginis]|uniref:Uncharacterized protein n=1 Tax=Arctia plantaginis TaxID=874455 RepID=A0A8S1AJF2_ARCPL|nr:unnamed protein product [Arctia plantaginis]